VRNVGELTTPLLYIAKGHHLHLVKESPLPPSKGLPPTRSAPIERAYVMSKKGAATFGMVVTGTF